MRMTITADEWVLYAARALSLLWAGFWLWFGIASGIGEGLTPFGVFMHTVPGIVCLIPALIAWKWERPGSWVLVLFAVLIAVLYLYLFRHRLTLPVRLLTAALLSLPPLAAGLLYLWHLHRIHRPA